ncbi:ribonuclease HII [Aureimonas jatrophae]|uniref:ribonuclease HII n=1 Tax=Aureimonas jatrophae TaxID=1166073 RepID=UPI000A79F9B9|nr:ribonuclease HII [Aureimonas jatrophae]
MPRLARTIISPSFEIEDAGPSPVCGVDEAGRGPLAGPVVAAAVILDRQIVPDGIGDSKTLTASQREAVFRDILRHAEVGFAYVSASEIDRLNIRRATLLAMRRAVAALPRRPAMVLVDGRDTPPGLMQPARAVVGGDALSLSIGAASIVAKVMRDRVMREIDRQDGRYGFARHMGYPTVEHRLALERHGPSPYHRMTFGPLKSWRANGGP